MTAEPCCGDHVHHRPSTEDCMSPAPGPSSWSPMSSSGAISHDPDGRPSDQATIFRLRLAVEILCAWTRDSEPGAIVLAWFEGGMRGAIPWPVAPPMFARWAAARGLSDCGGFVGYRLIVGDAL